MKTREAAQAPSPLPKHKIDNPRRSRGRGRATFSKTNHNAQPPFSRQQKAAAALSTRREAAVIFPPHPYCSHPSSPQGAARARAERTPHVHDPPHGFKTRGLNRTKASAPARRWPLSPPPPGPVASRPRPGHPFPEKPRTDGSRYARRPAWATDAPGGPGTGEEASGEGEPRAFATKTRRRERNDGAEEGATGAAVPVGVLASCPVREHHLARYHPGRPATWGVRRVISLSFAPLFPSPGPPVARPRESRRGWAAAAAPRGGRHRPLPLTPAEPGTRGGRNHDSRASGYTVSSRLPASASIRGSEPRK